MTLYGLYIRDLNAGDFVWFTTDKSLEPGAYLLGQHHAGSPNVYVAERIPALVLQVGPLIQQVEDLAQSTLNTTNRPLAAKWHIEAEMTEGLLQRLTENRSIWVSNPDWVNDLHPVPTRSG